MPKKKTPGSWTKRGKDAYRLRVCCGTDYTGKPNIFTKTIHCRSDAAADKELAKFYTECASGQVSRADHTALSVFSEKWVSERAAVRCKISTLANYEQVINSRIEPVFGKVKLSKIQPLQIQEWINAMCKDGLSPKTIKNIFAVLNGILSAAVLWGILAVNPCDKVELPSLKKKEADSYTEEETLALITCVDQLPPKELSLKVGILLALFGGLRKGEICGLDWSAVDFSGSGVNVLKTRMDIRKVGQIEDTPKSSSGYRWVPLPATIMKDLESLQLQQKKLKLQQGSQWMDSGAVLTESDGRSTHPDVFARRVSRFLNQNGLRHISLHKLRHTCVSLLAHMQVDLTEISKMIGHAQLSTTLNIYTHLFQKQKRETSDAIELFFDQNLTNVRGK